VILGVDESHRGAIVGPLFVACVLGPIDVPGLRDSKALSEKRRLELESLIKEANPWGLGMVTSQELDEIDNVWTAEQTAIDRAIEDLRTRGDPTWAMLVMDGNCLPKKIHWPPILMQAIVKADSKYPEVMAASVIAKCEADRWLSAQEGADTWKWSENHGYPNPQHIQLIREKGESPLRRRTFHVKALGPQGVNLKA
jgi:ribonuclease HII